MVVLSRPLCLLVLLVLLMLMQPCSTSAPYLAAARPRHTSSSAKNKVPTLKVFDPNWIRSKAPAFDTGTHVAAARLCLEHKAPALSNSLKMQLIKKLTDEVFHLHADVRAGSIDKSVPSARVAGVFASRELIACLLREQETATLGKNRGGVADQSAKELSILLLLHAAADMKLLMAAFDGALMAGQEFHLLTSYFNQYMLRIINFFMALLEEAVEGEGGATEVLGRRAELAATYQFHNREYDRSDDAAAKTMDYNSYALLVTHESLYGAWVPTHTYIYICPSKVER